MYPATEYQNTTEPAIPPIMLTNSRIIVRASHSQSSYLIDHCLGPFLLSPARREEPPVVLVFAFLVFVFFSTRSFQAVRRAPASTSPLAAAKRICVCPILPHPPGMGR